MERVGPAGSGRPSRLRKRHAPARQLAPARMLTVSEAGGAAPAGEPRPLPPAEGARYCWPRSPAGRPSEPPLGEGGAIRYSGLGGLRMAPGMALEEEEVAAAGCRLQTRRSGPRRAGPGWLRASTRLRVHGCSGPGPTRPPVGGSTACGTA